MFFPTFVLMPYALRYFCEYMNKTSLCRLELLGKDFIGKPQAIQGSGNTFHVEKQDDDPFTPVQSQTGIIEIIADDRKRLSIDTFYSEDDTYWLVQHYVAGVISFVGYLVQGEESEGFVDSPKYITLSASDNLASLSDVDFPGAFQKYTVLEYIQMCLNETGLSLPLRIYDNIAENSTQDKTDTPTATFTDQTVIYSGRFANSDGTFQKCFEILSEILEDFFCILRQWHGEWIVCRPAEFKNAQSLAGIVQYSNGNRILSSFDLTPVTLAPNYANSMVGGESNTRQNIRPFKFAEETFKYEQPTPLIPNLDLLTLGNQIAQSTRTDNPGTPQQEIITLTDYVATAWYLNPVYTGISYFIRVETDSKGIEINRYLVTKTTSSGSIDVVAISTGLYVNKGDKITINVSGRVPNDPGSASYFYYVRIYDGVSRRFLSIGNNTIQDGTWATTVQPVRSPFNPTGSNYTEFHSWGGESLQIPVDGWLNIELGVQNSNGGQTDWKDIQLTYQPFINESTLITGQTHTQTQVAQIKSSSERDRNIDDSPRNTIAGTLLTNAVTIFNQGNTQYYFPNPAQDKVTRTSAWHRYNKPESLRLGQLTTLERLQANRIPRMVIDCTIDFTANITAFTIFTIAALPGINFIIGRIGSLSYQTNTIECTLIELWRNGETDVPANYDFEYLYRKSDG